MTNDELKLLRAKLKCGEYDGVDIMHAWMVLDELLGADLPAAQPEPAAPTVVEPDLFTTDIVPRPLKYPLSDYHKAMSEGPLHYTWQDKPHRLVYDLIAAVRYYATPPRTALTDEQIYGLFERTGLSKYHVRDSQVAGEYDRLILTFARAVIAASEGKP